MKTHAMLNLRRRDLLKATGAVIAVGLVAAVGRDVIAADVPLKIGIIGSGRVGSALAGAWARTGHEVMLSSRNLENDKKLAAEIGAHVHAGTPQEAAAFGEVVVLAVPYSAFPELEKDLGSSLKGKLVINASNPFPTRDGAIANEVRTQGAGLFDRQHLAGAHVVRAFNAVGFARMASAHEDPGRSVCRSRAMIASRSRSPRR
jgi:8-hydroxy-5-deazaflavin:NADPH oxidoreductase